MSPPHAQAIVVTGASRGIAPRAAAYDESAEFPWDNVRDINALGLNSMFVPEEHGGTVLPDVPKGGLPWNSRPTSRPSSKPAGASPQTPGLRAAVSV